MAEWLAEALLTLTVVLAALPVEYLIASSPFVSSFHGWRWVL